MTRSDIRFRSTLLIAALSAVFLLPPVAAQEEGDEAKSEKKRPVIQDEVFVEGELPAIPTSNSVAAKLPLALRETPASVGIIDAELIEEQDAVTLGDALQNVSGLNVQPGSGTFDFYVVRGVDSLTSGLVLTDGAPEPETTAYPLYNIERVEVLKGPASFLYGGGPMSSTVNLVRKQPLDGDFLTFGASGGSFSTWEATVDGNLANADGTLSFRFNGLSQSSDNYRDNMESDHLAVFPSLTWRPNERVSVNVSYEFSELDYISDSGLPLVFGADFVSLAIPDVPRTRSYQSPADVSEQEATRFQVDVEARLSERLTLRNKTYYRELDWFTRGTTFNGVFPDLQGNLNVSRLLNQLDDAQTFSGNQLEILGRFGENVTHNLLFGVEYGVREDVFDFSLGFLPDLDLFNPQEPGVDPFIFPFFAADTETTIVAPYVVDQISFNDKFQLLLGARYDTIDFEDRLNQVERDDEQLSPMAGIVLLPSPEWSFYASWGEGFAPQSTFVVGVNRDPEESEQAEIGARYTGRRLNASLAAYRIERRNIAIPDSFTGILQQTGSQEADGLELEISFDFTAGLNAKLAYAWTDAELTDFREVVQFGSGPTDFFVVDRSGNTPAFTPEHLLSLWVGKKLGGGFGIGGGARYLSEQFIAENNTFELDSYGLLDASLWWDRGSWRFNVNLRNLTDEEYYTRSSRGTSVIPMPGFEAYAGFQYRL